MTTSDIRDFPRYSDTLRLRDGRLLSVRFMEPRDREAIQAYYRALSPTSRYNRFLGATSELPPTQLEQFVHIGEDDRFTVLVTTMIDGDEAIVGEARYAIDLRSDRFEFGLSLGDGWQGQGIGAALIREGLGRLEEHGAQGCVVLGEPEYYSRFGFAHDTMLTYPGPPADYFQRLVLCGDAPSGVVSYSKAFG